MIIADKGVFLPFQDHRIRKGYHRLLVSLSSLFKAKA